MQKPDAVPAQPWFILDLWLIAGWLLYMLALVRHSRDRYLHSSLYEET